MTKGLVDYCKELCDPTKNVTSKSTGELKSVSEEFGVNDLQTLGDCILMIKKYCIESNMNKEDSRNKLCNDILLRIEVEIRRLEEERWKETRENFIQTSETLKKTNEIIEQLSESLKQDQVFQKSVIRSKVDYKLRHLLAERFNEEIKYNGTDVPIYDGKNQVGDVDSLFTSPTTHYLCERKRHAKNAAGLLEQITRTANAYKKKNPEFNIVSVFYAEAADQNLLETLRNNGVFVLDQDMKLLIPTN
jgi:hypothetical protein